MAGRIPQHFIDDLLARIDIIDIVDSRVKLKKTGRNYSACCPFHKEKTPSFTVSPDKQFYYCFGCGASGNALGFIMDFDHLDFPAAVDDLAGQLGLEVPREQSSSHTKRPDHSNLYDLMERAAVFFKNQLQNHPQSANAKNYLQHRGLDSHQIQQFGIGFAPPGWDNLQSHLSDTPEQEQRLIQSGMLVENEDNNRIYDRFRNRIMFPIRDSRGRYIAFGGRVLGDEKPKYLNSPESPIFHKGKELYGLYEARQANRTLKNILVVEGYMDVVALTQQGITNSVATLGTATTSDHMQRLFKVVPEVIFCFDGDDAGRRAAWRALESTLPHMEDGRQARFLFLPQGEDPDSMVRSEGADQFEERIHSQALSIDTFMFRELEEGINLNTMDGNARLAKLAQPYLNQLPEGIFKQLILQKLSGLTGLDTDKLASHLSDSPAPKITRESSTEPFQDGFDPPQGYYHPEHSQQSFSRQGYTNIQPNQPTSKISGSGYAIRQLLCNTRLAENISCIDELRQHNSPDCQLLVKLLDTLKSDPGLSAIALIAQWHNTETGQRLQELATFDLGAKANEQEFHETLDHLKKQAIKSQHKHQLDAFKKQLPNASTSQINSEQRKKLQQLIEQKRQQFRLTGKNTEKK